MLCVWLVLYLMVLLETLLLKVCGIACFMFGDEPDVTPVEAVDSRQTSEGTICYHNAVGLCIWYSVH